MHKILVNYEQNLKYLYKNMEKILFINGEKEEEIATDCKSNFDACIDDEGRLNVIYLNSQNELILLTLVQGIWNKKILYSHKEKDTHLDNFHFFIKNKTVHIFYTSTNLKKPYETLLLHHKWDKNWTGGVITLIKGPVSFPFYEVYVEDEKNIHLLYTTSEKGKMQLFYMFYSNNSWSPKNLISETEKIFYPSLVIDDEKNLHFLWGEEDIIQEIKYRKKTPGSWPKGSFTPPFTLSYSVGIDALHLIGIEKNLWGIYMQKGEFFAFISSDNGNSWSKPFKLAFGK
ncbi:MAG: hypothetical protein ACPLSA_08490, partial [Caldanaerobacter sp.]